MAYRACRSFFVPPGQEMEIRNALSSSASTWWRTPYSSANRSPRTDLDGLIEQDYPSSTLKQLQRNSAVYVMLVHFRIRFHKDQDDVKVRILGERPGTAAGTSLPRILLSEFLKLFFEMKMEGGSG